MVNVAVLNFTSQNEVYMGTVERQALTHISEDEDLVLSSTGGMGVGWEATTSTNGLLA